MISYESICDKLGFSLEDYNPQRSDTEDDSIENPFKRLSGQELDFVLEYLKKNNIGK